MEKAWKKLLDWKQEFGPCSRLQVTAWGKKPTLRVTLTAPLERFEGGVKHNLTPWVEGEGKTLQSAATQALRVWDGRLSSFDDWLPISLDDDD